MRAKKLTAAFARTVSEAGKYGDGGGAGLALLVKPTGRKSWVQRISVSGRRRNLGLGPYPKVSLHEAREKALENWKSAFSGQDPLAAKRKVKRMQAIPTFRSAAESVIALYAPSWAPGGKSEAQWRASLQTYAFARLGRKRVTDVTSADVMACLAPIWNTKRETARRVRQRISRIMLWCIAQGYRQDNPAGDAVAAALPRVRGGPRNHQRALPYSRLPDALGRIRSAQAQPAARLGLEFLILTAARSGEVRGATWKEVDLESRTWTVPAGRMKSRREHRVPLSDQALSVLRAAREFADNSCLIFPSSRGGSLADSSFSRICRDSEIESVPHGFRSSFRDWAAECTSAPHAVMEAALAHTIPNAAEAAYARSDLFEKRRKLMNSWGDYVTGLAHGQVVAFPAVA